MKISPISAPTNTVSAPDPQVGRAEKVRSLRMNTNATPGGVEPPAAQEVSIPDDNVTNNETPKADDAETQPLSPQFAALAKQRRALQQEKRAFEDQKKAFEASKSQGSDSIDIARLKSEPLKVLQEIGVTYDQLTEAILGNQGNSEINALKAEIKALKEGVDQRFTEEKSQERQQVLSEMTREATTLVASGDDFELVRETGSVPDVIKLIEKNYDETGEVLEVAEALKLVEEELFARQQKLANLKKMQGLYKPAEPQPQPRSQGMRTLTNNHTASVPMGRKERALAAAYGTLKK